MRTMIKALGLGLVFSLSMAAAIPASATDLKMMTGPQGGSWVPLGGQIKDMWEKAIPGLAIQVLPGAGIANARAVEEGKAEVGFGNSISTVDARAWQGAVQQAGDQYLQSRHALSAIFPVRRQRQLRHQHDSPISRARAITTQQRGNTGELITRQLLEVNGDKVQRREGQLCRLFQLGEPDEGRSRRRVRARHANAGRCHHGPRRLPPISSCSISRRAMRG